MAGREHASIGAVAILPYGTRVDWRLAMTPLDALRWPLGRPGRLIHGTVADLEASDHLLCYPTSRLLYMPRPGVRAKVSVMIVEPAAVHGRNMAWLRVLHRRFYRVLTSNTPLLCAIPNGRLHLFGSSWIPDWRTIDIVKTRQASLIASAKTYYEGHKLRHRVVDWVRNNGADVDILGRGYKPFEHKADGLAPYRYSVVIENVREENLFTEKLVDCLLCETVPIYWGAPNAGDLFDARGMILCDTFDDIAAALQTMSEGDYSARLEFVRQNREKAAQFADHEANAARILAEEA